MALPAEEGGSEMRLDTCSVPGYIRVQMLLPELRMTLFLSFFFFLCFYTRAAKHFNSSRVIKTGFLVTKEIYFVALIQNIQIKIQ